MIKLSGALDRNKWYILILLALFFIFGFIYAVESVSRKLTPGKDRDLVVLYLKGLVSNPAALYEASLLNEQKGDLPNALIDMRLAITIIELNNPNSGLLTRYRNRLNKLNKSYNEELPTSGSTAGAKQ